MTTETDARKDLINACREMNAVGLNQGTSGNISVRHGDQMLISPSAVPYDQLAPDMIASMDLSGSMTGEWDGPLKPSTEWRFHWKLLNERGDLSAIVHAHPVHCTALAILRRSIPACHYMIAAFGGSDVRCADYHTFGTVELADMVVDAMTDRTACLLANHGMVAGGGNIAQAIWRAVELETIAHQYHLALQIGDPVLLSEEEIDETLKLFAGYGLQDTRA